MSSRFITAAAVAGALIAFSGSAAWAQNVAIVNGKAVPLTRVDMLAKQMERSGRPVPADAKDQLRDVVITREIFMQEAQKMGVDTSDEFRDQLEMVRQELLIREVFTRFQKENAVSDAEAKAEYDKFAAANAGKEYQAHHILVEKEADAKSIIAQLKSTKKGAPTFEAIAKKSSKDPGSGANGGALDWAPSSSYVKEFADAMVALKKGQTTDAPVKSQFGYHIIRLDDVRDAQLPKFEEVKPQIVQQLMQQKVGMYQQELRAKAKVE